MKQDVTLGEIMADRWRDFVVESYQLGWVWAGLGEEKWTLPLLGIDNVFPRGSCCGYFKHRSAGIMLEFVIIDVEVSSRVVVCTARLKAREPG